MVPYAVLGLIGKIAVAGTKETPQFVIILTFDIPIINDQADGSAGGQALEYSRQNLDFIGLPTAGGMGLHSGAPSGQFRFDISDA
jgi:hypothetical protein